MKRVLQVLVACCGLLFAIGESGAREPAAVNHPIAQAEFRSSDNYSTLSPIIWSFSRANNFAVQEILTQPRGVLDFTVQLYRDDIRLSISRMRGEAVMIMAYPLCVCELDHRIGLREGANASVNDLREAFARH